MSCPAQESNLDSSDIQALVLLTSIKKYV